MAGASSSYAYLHREAWVQPAVEPPPPVLPRRHGHQSSLHACADDTRRW